MYVCIGNVQNGLTTSLNVFGYVQVVFENPGTPRMKISNTCHRKSSQV